MYNRIWSPLKQEFVETLSYEGKKALKMYVNSFMTGGSGQPPKVVTEGVLVEPVDEDELVRQEVVNNPVESKVVDDLVRQVGVLARQEPEVVNDPVEPEVVNYPVDLLTPPPPLVDLNGLDYEQIESAANSISKVVDSPTEENVEDTIKELSTTITDMKKLNQ